MEDCTNAKSARSAVAISSNRRHRSNNCDICFVAEEDYEFLYLSKQFVNAVNELFDLRRIRVWARHGLFYFLFPVPAPIAARLVLGAVEFSSALRAFLQE
jgi:hypothetical protein